MSTVFRKQAGVALLTALMVVALATTLSVSLSTRLQVDIRRSANLIAADQAMQWMLAAEDWSRRVLRQDREENAFDHTGENWAIVIPPLPVEGGTISGQLRDLQSCLNINSLYQGNTIDTLARDRFRNLLSRLEPQVSGDPVQAVIDWLDPDLETSIPDGAEDSYYLGLEQPYRSANTAMHSPSELRLVRGFESGEIYDGLLPLVCAFTEAADINVNTAPAEVLRSIASTLTDSDVDDILTRRDEEPFENMNQFLEFNELRKKIEQARGLSVNSDYFLLEAVAEIGRARSRMYSIIKRNDKGETEILARSYGAW